MVTTLIRNKKPYNKHKDTSVYILYIFAGPAQPANPAQEELVRQLGWHIIAISSQESMRT